MVEQTLEKNAPSDVKNNDIMLEVRNLKQYFPIKAA